MDVAERGYLSIGEVLALLKEEFPDITISKIRFLESQGLLDPERTPSGYRKFYDDDVERLRWILRQQREHFLPLKVIKGRLQTGGEGESEGDDAEPSTVGDPTAIDPAESEAGGRREAPHTDVAALIEPPTGATPVRTTPAPAPLLAAAPSGASLTLDELCAASDLTAADVTELERFGLLAGRPVAGVVYYDEDALLVARLAAQFRRFGVQARHLRMYRTAAEREAGFAEQDVLPLLKQRNPEARRQAVETLEELARLGQTLRGAMLRQLLRQYLEGPS